MHSSMHTNREADHIRCHKGRCHWPLPCLAPSCPARNCASCSLIIKTKKRPDVTPRFTYWTP